MPTKKSWFFQHKLPVVRLNRKAFVRAEILDKIVMEGLLLVKTVLKSKLGEVFNKIELNWYKRGERNGMLNN